MAYSDGSHWVTLEDGQHVLLGSDGTILSGLGGNFNGKTFEQAFSQPKQSDGLSSGFSGVYDRFGNTNNATGNKDKAISKISAQLSNDLSDKSIDTYEFGEGSTKHQAIAMNRQEKMLSGGRYQTTDIEVSVNSPRKVMGRIYTKTRERIGIGNGEGDWSKSSQEIDFENYDDLLQKLKALRR